MIGYVRNNKKPTSFARLLASYAKAFNIELLYYTPQDIDVKSGKVNGKIHRQGKWLAIRTELPSFNDVSSFCYKKENLAALNFLKENAEVSEPGTRRFNKLKMQELLSKDKKFSSLILSTKKVSSFDILEEFLKRKKRVILKPVGGQFGIGIFFVEQTAGDEYKIKFDDKEDTVNKRGLLKFYESEIETKSFIVQQYIHSTSKEGYPFDCRINVEKNINGEWVIARKFIRMGIGQAVVSNMSQGGAALDVKPFLKSNFPDNWQEIIDNLQKVGKELPYKIEELRNAKLMTLGIDIGIDVDGKIYLFETNSAPGTTQLRAEAGMLRVEYYRYMLSKIRGD